MRMYTRHGEPCSTHALKMMSSTTHRLAHATPGQRACTILSRSSIQHGSSVEERTWSHKQPRPPPPPMPMLRGSVRRHGSHSDLPRCPLSSTLRGADATLDHRRSKRAEGSSSQRDWSRASTASVREYPTFCALDRGHADPASEEASIRVDAGGRETRERPRQPLVRVGKSL